MSTDSKQSQSVPKARVEEVARQRAEQLAEHRVAEMMSQREAEFEARLATARSEARVVSASPAVSKIKVREPEPFDGNQAKFKPFVTALQLQFKLHAQQFTHESDKVMYAAAYLTGNTQQWFEPFLTDFINNEEKDRKEETDEYFASFDYFRKQLARLYGDPDAAKTAERKLHQLVQTGSASHYVAHFQRLASHVDWDEAALRSTFYRGLKEHIKNEFMRMGDPEDLEGTVERALRVDARYAERRMEQQNGGRNRYPKYPVTRTRGDPMELDAVQYKKKGGGPKINLTREEREYRMKNKLCLYCGREGHRVKDCRDRKRNKPSKQLNATAPQSKSEIWGHDTERIRAQNQNQDWNAIPRVQTKAREVLGTQNQKDNPKHPEHATLSWTGCYEDSCAIHRSDKDGAGWYPRRAYQQLAATRRRPTPYPENSSRGELSSEDDERPSSPWSRPRPTSAAWTTDSPMDELEYEETLPSQEATLVESTIDESQERQKLEDEVVQEELQRKETPLEERDDYPLNWEAMLWKLVIWTMEKVLSEQPEPHIREVMKPRIQHVLSLLQMDTAYKTQVRTFIAPRAQQLLTPDGYLLTAEEMKIRAVDPMEMPSIHFLEDIGTKWIPLEQYHDHLQQRLRGRRPAQ